MGKGTGPSNLPKPILASFCHASKNGRKKARKSFKLLGFSQRHLFWCGLMVDLKRLELSTSRMRTERSPEWFRYMHPKFLKNVEKTRILRKHSVMSFSYKTLFRLPRSKEKCLLYYGHNFEDATQTAGKLATHILSPNVLDILSANAYNNVILNREVLYAR